jgi:hypothetical protein
LHAGNSSEALRVCSFLENEATDCGRTIISFHAGIIFAEAEYSIGNRQEAFNALESCGGELLEHGCLQTLLETVGKDFRKIPAASLTNR